MLVIFPLTTKKECQGAKLSNKAQEGEKQAHQTSYSVDLTLLSKLPCAAYMAEIEWSENTLPTWLQIHLAKLILNRDISLILRHDSGTLMPWHTSLTLLAPSILFVVSLWQILLHSQSCSLPCKAFKA